MAARRLATFLWFLAGLGLSSGLVLPVAPTFARTGLGANSQDAPPVLVDLLPSAADLPVGLSEAETGGRTEAEVAATFLDPADATVRLDEWGFAGNAFRRFEEPEGHGGTPEIVEIEVSLHRFRSGPDAVEAAAYYAEGRQAALGLAPVAVEPVGDASVALRGPVPDGDEATMYVVEGSVLARVTVVAQAGDPMPVAVGVGRGVAAEAFGGGPTPATETPRPRAPTPTAAPAPTATPKPTPPPASTTADLPCENAEGVDGMAEVAGVASEQVAPFFACRQLETGEWIEATIGDDRPFVHPGGIDPEEVPGIDRGRKRLRGQIEEMLAFHAFANVFRYSLDDHTLHLPGADPIPLAGQPTLGPIPGGGTMLGNLFLAYEPLAITYMDVSAGPSLARYAAWYMGNRDYYIWQSAGREAVPEMLLQAVLASMRYQRVPWPWELADPFMIDQFLIDEAIAAGVVAPPAGT